MAEFRSIWEGLRITTETQHEQSLVGALDEHGDLGWLEDDRDDATAHFARKPWIAAMLHDTARNDAYGRAIAAAAAGAPETFTTNPANADFDVDIATANTVAEGSAAYIASLNSQRRDGKAAQGQVCGTLSADGEAEDSARAAAFVRRYRAGEVTTRDSKYGFGLRIGGEGLRVGPRYKSLLAHALMNQTFDASIPLFDITRTRGRLQPGDYQRYGTI